VQLDSFQTLADPVRRRILGLLRTGEQQVNDVVAELDIHQSGVSRHLRILLDVGFVQVRPEGQRRYYSLRPERFVELHTWLDAYRDLWESRLDRFGKALEAKQRARKSKSAQEKKR
jgi:DNA-binding transcriptional ArsR family regulator